MTRSDKITLSVIVGIFGVVVYLLATNDLTGISGLSKAIQGVK